MAIFNSYVKLPEGSESSGTKERGLCPPRSHCKPFVGGGLRLVEGRRLFGLSKLCLWATGYPKNATGLNKRHWFYIYNYIYIYIIYIYIYII